MNAYFSLRRLRICTLVCFLSLSFVTISAEAVRVSKSGGDAGAIDDLKQAVESAFVCAEDNGNERFTLRAVLRGKEERWQGLALHVKEKRFHLAAPIKLNIAPWYGNAVLLMGSIGHAESAGEVAAALGGPLLRRSRPNYDLVATFKTDREVFRIGENPKVIIDIKNLGPQTAFLLAQTPFSDPAQRTADFEFAPMAIRNDQSCLDFRSDISTGGFYEVMEIRSGENWVTSVALDKWCRLVRPGSVRLLGLFRARAIPSADSYKMATEGALQWETTVSGEFQFRVEK